MKTIWAAIGVLAALVAAVFPVGLALAAYSEEISLDTSEGEVGDYVYVDGYDFDESGEEVEYYVYVKMYFTDYEAEPGDDIDDEVENYEIVESSEWVDEDGEFEEVRIRVPAELTDGDDDVDVDCGTYYICVTYSDDDEIVAVADFSVLGGEIEIDPEEGIIGTEVEIAGTSFAADTGLTVEFEGDEIDIESGDDEADSDGEFELTVIIPEATAGEHTITVSGDEEGCAAEATFTIEPEVTVSPLEAPPGDSITISGTGFGGRKDVYITVGSVDFADAAETDADGSFSISLDVPDLNDGVYYINVEDESGNYAPAIEFMVEEDIDLDISPATSSAQPGHVGMDVTISGTAFKPKTQVTITYASTPQTVATTTSDTKGNFTAVFPIPESAAGSHTITASDGTNSLKVSFYMESTPPDAPALLLPAAEDKAEALTSFEWEAVSDDSPPVVYTLQVATGEGFTSTTLVLVKEGLTSPEYTLTEEEKLAGRSAEEPYYWRVRATDGADNESDWSEVGQFQVAASRLPTWTVTLFGFTISGWTILWWVLGCLASGLGGYWVGKRQTSRY